MLLNSKCAVSPTYTRWTGVFFLYELEKIRLTDVAGKAVSFKIVWDLTV